MVRKGEGTEDSGDGVGEATVETLMADEEVHLVLDRVIGCFLSSLFFLGKFRGKVR